MNDNINLIKVKNTISKILNQEFGDSFDYEKKYIELLNNSEHYINIIIDKLKADNISYIKKDINDNYAIILEQVKQTKEEKNCKRKDELYDTLYNKLKELIKNVGFDKFESSAKDDDYKNGIIIPICENSEEINYLFNIWNEVYDKAVADSSSEIKKQEMDKKFEQLMEEKEIKANKKAREQINYKEEKLIKHKGLFLIGAVGYGFLKGLYNASGHGKKKR